MALLQLPVPQSLAGGGVLERRISSSASFVSTAAAAAAHGGAGGCDLLCFPHFLGGWKQSSPWSDFRRTQRLELISRRCSGSNKQDGYGTLRSDSRRTEENNFRRQRESSGKRDGYRTSRADSEENDFNKPEVSYGGKQNGYRTFRADFVKNEPEASYDGKQDGYRTSRADFVRNDFTKPEVSYGGKQDGYRTSRADFTKNEFNRPEVSYGGKQNGSGMPESESGRDQRKNVNSQRFSGGGQKGYTIPWLESNRTQRSNSDFQRNGPGGNDTEGYAGRSRSIGSGTRETSSGQYIGKGSWRNNSVKTLNPIPQTITRRQSTSKFVSDRTVHQAPWEQGGRSSSSSSGFVEDVENDGEDDDDDDDDDVDDDFRGLDDDRGFRESDDDSTTRFDGRSEKSAMARIAEKLSSIPQSRGIYEPKYRAGLGLREGPDPTFGPKYGQPVFPTVGRDWSTPDHPVPSPSAPSAKKFLPDTRFPWERNDDRAAAEGSQKFTRVKPPSLAELTLPEDELKRLRNLGILTRHRIKVGKLGVTNGIVESIHNEWRNSEVVRVKCEGPTAQNMKSTHEALEERTGGLVVWRAGGACLVYRGKDYVPPPLKGLDFSEESTSVLAAKTDGSKAAVEDSETDETLEGSNELTPEQRVVIPRIKSVYDPELEREMEEILSALGPRYDEWTGMKPVPVDADLLVAPPGKFVKPLRLLPYGVKPNLSSLEMTNLRRLGRPIPPHFVLGVNRGLNGLAAAIIKLWEKSAIAKIGVKRGVQNTNHERMAEQLKRLTGGLLLGRDKYFIVLYRGKDFLPPSVAAVLEERQAMTTALQEEEEKVRSVPQSKEVSDSSVERSIAGTLAETLEAQANWEKLKTSDDERKTREEAAKAARREIARRIQRKISTTLAKKEKAEWELQKVQKLLRPAGPPVDRETITDEERHMFSKLGLKMHAFLLLGRRGIFGGTVENMHLHWKHRELVKIIYKATNKVDLEQTARMLEYESGGILVATVPTNKGQAIIVYRGKNYQRPPELRPQTLLTKRQALKKCTEMQRQMALTMHLQALEESIGNMQADLGKLGEEETGNSELATNNHGRSNVVAGLARAIRIHFQKHALVKVGVRGGAAKGTPVEEIRYQLEEATGGTLVSHDDSKIILYRGWPEGQQGPTEGNGHWEDLSPELQSAMVSEAEAEEDYLHESDWDEFEDEDEGEESHESDWDESGDEDEGEAGEENERENLVEAQATTDSSEVDDDMDWDEEDEYQFDLRKYESQLSRKSSSKD